MCCGSLILGKTHVGGAGFPGKCSQEISTAHKECSNVPSVTQVVSAGGGRVPCPSSFQSIVHFAFQGSLTLLPSPLQPTVPSFSSQAAVLFEAQSNLGPSSLFSFSNALHASVSLLATVCLGLSCVSPARWRHCLMEAEQP